MMQREELVMKLESHSSGGLLYLKIRVIKVNF